MNLSTLNESYSGLSGAVMSAVMKSAQLRDSTLAKPDGHCSSPGLISPSSIMQDPVI